ncbi:unknown protein [Microcystis aeruginosa NIES-843]|uniref:Uncharacterized protein n=1 Tax=Microcystis aeruginosa (strain NIES-843 / IAM M-2473) TaxID=449447 RepID=B0JJ74_MICAN|nr:unknown protein [Microcystis aeruginosa NIES-843]
MTSCFAGRDKPDLIASHRIDNHQNSTKHINTDCDKPFFIKPFVWNRNCQIVGENGYCISKVNTMLAKIGCCLSSIPLVSHLNYSMHTCTYYQELIRVDRSRCFG